MKEKSVETTALEIRKVALAKKAFKGFAISIICFSLLSFAFVIGYTWTFQLFR